MKNLIAIVRKELFSFFTSPAALIFFGTFLVVNLFIFFWVKTFFARNIADIRPLFEWMPVLLIFLSSAITMRMWAEEKRSGTLEFLVTSPVGPVALVLGKFAACMTIILVALILTLPLPISVSFMGDLDWGPVWGGYLATLFLSSSYVAMGLLASSKSENQIVSLILSTLLCGFFYMLGSDMVTSFWGNRNSEILKLLGTGSRFVSITRGVIDFRDLYYYLGLAAIFLTLNVYTLERIRWVGNSLNPHHVRWVTLTILVMANFVAVNLWLAPINFLRADITQGSIYSISDTTTRYVSMLKEPLLIRGYFSARTHPLLAPLVPRLKDLISEYEVSGKGHIRVEFIDPAERPEIEEEAGQKYGIRPVPFQTASKYQTAITNSYFDILIKYGDQFETLNFRDLIEVKVQNQSDVAVDLKNPEYDITKAIKKVLYAYQGEGNLFDNIKGDVVFTGYISPDNRLPQPLIDLKSDLKKELEHFSAQGKDRFKWNIVDPDADNGKMALEIENKFGFRPMAASIIDTETFWFYMTFRNGERIEQIPMPEDFEGASLKMALDNAIKRFESGFLKTVALHHPPVTPPMPQFGVPGSGKSFMSLTEQLESEHLVKETDLKNGHVPEDTDLLILLSPEKLDEKQLFAIDQFLMQGGTVIISTSPFDIDFQSSLMAIKKESGLEDWLAYHGVVIEDSMVLDRVNSAFPIPVQRQVGGFVVQETMMIDYPYFVDIRKDGMNDDTGIFSGVNQVTMNWSSPVNWDEAKGGNDLKSVWLLKTSPDAWLSSSLDIQPNFKLFPETGFNISGEQKSMKLAFMLEGNFLSWFKDRASPLAIEDEEENKKSDDKDKEIGKNDEKHPEIAITRVIEKSSDSARIILFASNVFLSDTALDITSAAMSSRYTAPVELIENCVDWSLEDRGLLSIRGRGHFSRPLMPLDREGQMFWEYLNYSVAVIGLFFVWLTGKLAARRSVIRCKRVLASSQERRA